MYIYFLVEITYTIFKKNNSKMWWLAFSQPPHSLNLSRSPAEDTEDDIPAG